MLFVTDGSIQRRGFSLSIMSTDEKGLFHCKLGEYLLPFTFMEPQNEEE